MPGAFGNLHVAQRWRATSRGGRCDRDLVGPGASTRNTDGRGALNVQHVCDKVAYGDSQMAPETALQARVVLRAAEDIAHQLPEDCAAAHELHHAGGHRCAQKRSAVETTDDPRGEFQFRRKRSFYPHWVFFGAAFGER